MTPEQAQALVDANPPMQHEVAIALRDGFACAALTGLLAHHTNPIPGLARVTAVAAYALADAMMAARGGS